MPKREVIDTAQAPHTGLPYAQAIRYGDLVFVAGQVALDPKTNQPSGAIWAYAVSTSRPSKFCAT